MDTVYLLWHVHNFGPDKDDEKLIGIYSSESKAQEALARVKDQPGFVDTQEGFEIHPHKIDRDSWAEGFTTV